jgi:hypothetical protein
MHRADSTRSSWHLVRRSMPWRTSRSCSITSVPDALSPAITVAASATVMCGATRAIFSCASTCRTVRPLITWCLQPIRSPGANRIESNRIESNRIESNGGFGPDGPLVRALQRADPIATCCLHANYHSTAESPRRCPLACVPGHAASAGPCRAGSPRGTACALRKEHMRGSTAPKSKRSHCRSGHCRQTDSKAQKGSPTVHFADPIPLKQSL